MQDREFFPCLKEASTPKGALGLSIGLHGLLLFVLILVPLLAPQTIRLRFNETMIVPPPPPRKVDVTPIKLPPLPKKITRPQPEIIAEKIPVIPPKPVLREPERPRVEPIPKPVAPVVAVKPAMFDAKPAPVAAPPPPPVVTNVFSPTPAAAAAPTPSRVAESAGFGIVSANSVNRSAKPELAVAAGFGDAGGGNGGGGSSQSGRPGRGQVAGVVGGFEGGVPGGTGTRPGGGSGGRGTVTAAGFMASADAPKAPTRSAARTVADSEKPVEILSKPRPDYTDEARKMRIEGEVLLRVLFKSSGEARVVEMVRGLGFGLNENAIRAAEQIRFKPAQRGGESVDSTATVHIVFQLAY
jgi:TonB family protein